MAGEGAELRMRIAAKAKADAEQDDTSDSDSANGDYERPRTYERANGPQSNRRGAVHTTNSAANPGKDAEISTNFYNQIMVTGVVKKITPRNPIPAWTLRRMQADAVKTERIGEG